MPGARWRRATSIKDALVPESRLLYIYRDDQSERNGSGRDRRRGCKSVHSGSRVEIGAIRYVLTTPRYDKQRGKKQITVSSTNDSIRHIFGK